MTFGSVNCGHCKNSKTVEKIISNNYLKCICAFCGYSYELSLLDITKKVIYLDQNIFSTAYNICKKGKKNSFDSIIERLYILAKKQLIICPYSDLHDIESHQMSEDGKKLFIKIKEISRGKRFHLMDKIKEQQIIRAFESFLDNEKLDKYELQLKHAIEPDVHDWDPSFRIDTDFSVSQFIPPSQTKKEKQLFTDQFIEFLPNFHKRKGTIWPSAPELAL